MKLGQKGEKAKLIDEEQIERERDREKKGEGGKKENSPVHQNEERNRVSRFKSKSN